MTNPAEGAALLPCPFCGLQPESNKMLAWCHGTKAAPHSISVLIDGWNNRATAASAPPDGWDWVPTEPTVDMLENASMAANYLSQNDCRRVWDAMLAVAFNDRLRHPPSQPAAHSDAPDSAQQEDAERWQVCLACVRQDSHGGWVIHEDDPHNADGTKFMFTQAIDAARAALKRTET